MAPFFCIISYMDFVGKRYYYGHSGTMVILNWYRKHNGKPGKTEDIYEIVREYENGKIQYQQKPKETIDRLIFKQTARYVEKVGDDVIAKYLLLKEE